MKELLARYAVLFNEAVEGLWRMGNCEQLPYVPKIRQVNRDHCHDLVMFQLQVEAEQKELKS